MIFAKQTKRRPGKQHERQQPRNCRATAAQLPRNCRATAAQLPRNCRATAAQLPRNCRATAASVALQLSARQLVTAKKTSDDMWTAHTTAQHPKESR